MKKEISGEEAIQKLRESRNPEELIEQLNKQRPTSLAEAKEQVRKNRERFDERMIKETIKSNKQTMKKGTFEALDPNHEIFTLLDKGNNAPKWWINILADKELYIEIRKDNYINVYFYGGCLIKITYDRSTKALLVLTHQKYMGDKTPIRKSETGKNIFEYRECRQQLENIAYLQFLKDNIKEIYLKDNENSDMKLKKNKLTVASEKKVQGELILKDRYLFIDSEFAYAIPPILREDKDKLIRLDLVSVDNGILKFIELKLINDPRLRGENIEKSGILRQMESYRKYIKHYQYEFVNYYNKIAEIKHKIGVWKEQPIINGIDTKPIILLVNNYSSLTDGRTERISNIKNILEKRSINYQIIDYSECK